MDKPKAKKAVKKSQARKEAAQAALAQEAAIHAVGASMIKPEVQSQRIDLQPADGYVNPYHAMGPMAPTMYSPGNLLDGYNYPMMVNPET